MMSDLAAWASALRAAVPLEDVPEIGVGVDRVEVTVWDENIAPTVRAAAKRIGIPGSVLHIVRPLVFLYPYPADEELNVAAYDQFVADNIRIDSEGHEFLLTSMAPAGGDNPRVLVLGSMPGALSLQQMQYYANPQNRFWRVMEQVAGVSADAPYQGRVNQLASMGIALWDTLKHCSRVRSFDASIVAKSEVPNDVVGFLGKAPTIQRIVFNGQKATKSFRRLIEPTMPLGRAILTVSAPSTSAANSRVDLPTLINAWREALQL